MVNKRKMEEIDHTEIRGYWWQPADPSVQWFGQLRWKPSKSPNLRLHYKSEDAAATPAGDVESFLGLDKNGTPISVLRAGLHSTKTSGFLSQKNYGAGHILRGIHVSRLDELRLNKVNVWLHYLGAWLGEEGFNCSDQRDGASRIEYRRPNDRVYQVSRNVTLKICHSSTASSQSRERIIRYDIFFSVEQQRPFSFNRAFHWIDALRGLLHFAYLRQIKATRITFERSDFTFQLGEKSYPKEIELFSGAIAEPIENDPLYFEFVFTFGEVRDRFADLCLKWFRFSAEQGEAMGCYMTTVYADVTCEVRLICLTQALEAFHQRRFRPTPKSEDAHFVNRIKSLCQRHQERMIAIVGDIEAFAISVRDSRHYYTHHDPSIRQNGHVLSGSKLTLMTYHLQYLFRLCVLSEFGLDADPHSILRRQIPGRIIEFY
jgi:ApeA N-terminal domain 1